MRQYTQVQGGGHMRLHVECQASEPCSLPVGLQDSRQRAFLLSKSLEALMGVQSLLARIPTWFRSIGMNPRWSAGLFARKEKLFFCGATNSGSAIKECRSWPRPRHSSSEMPAQFVGGERSPASTWISPSGTSGSLAQSLPSR